MNKVQTPTALLYTRGGLTLEVPQKIALDTATSIAAHYPESLGGLVNRHGDVVIRANTRDRDLGVTTIRKVVLSGLVQWGKHVRIHYASGAIKDIGR